MSSTKSAINCKSNTPTSWTNPKRTQKNLLPNLTKRKRSTKRRSNTRFELRRRRLRKWSPSIRNSSKGTRSLPKSSTSSRSKTKNSSKHSRNCSKSTTISDSRTSNLTKKFLRCNINSYKDSKSSSPKKKHAKMPATNKLPYKTLGTCLTTKFNLCKRRRPKWSTKSETEKLIWRICSMNWSRKVKKIRRSLLSWNSLIPRFKCSRKRSKLLKNRLIRMKENWPFSRRKCHRLPTATKMSKPLAKGLKNLSNSAKKLTDLSPPHLINKLIRTTPLRT